MFVRPTRRTLARATWRFTLVAIALAGIGAVRAHAATPSSGTLSASNPSATWTGSIAGAGTGENTCVNGVSCDSFEVILAPGDYTGKQIDVQISWTVPAYDYDLYVHADSLTGPRLPASAGPPPSTHELVHVGIDPPIVTTPRVWWAHPQAATVPPGMTYNGSATLVDAPPAPVVTHLASALPFSHTVTLVAPGTTRTEEPSVRVDGKGNCYVTGIRGVPAGVDLWRFDLDPQSATFDPELRHATYLGQPDVFQQMGAEDSTAGGADGGGDVEIATSFPATADETPVLTLVSLAAANISTSVSTDRGETWQHAAASAQIPADDRQWIADDGTGTVYLVYRAPGADGLFVQTSTDHGITYGPASPILVNNDPLDTTPGYIAVDHQDGTVYVSHQNANALYVSHSTDGGQTWTTVAVDAAYAHGHLFDPIAVGSDGTVYTVWSNDRHILYAFSTDHGNTWSAPGMVENPDTTRVNVFPWLAAGSAGRLDVVWFGTDSDNISAAQWYTYFSQSLDANTATPTFRQQRIADHIVHGQNISEGGLTGSADRNLGDFFEIAYDPQGAAVVAFSDDHNDFDGNCYVTRQLAGPSLDASANGTGYVNPVDPSGPITYDPRLPEVVDPVHDATLRLQPIPVDNPFDIVSIKYDVDGEGPDAPYLGARMTLSGLTAQPPAGNWRIAFTANAPDGDGPLPYGVSDQGDMFYMLASDSDGVASFTYGTAYRDSVPLNPLNAYVMAYNPAAGVADSGAIDTATSSVRIKVSLAKLNALLADGHAPIAYGSWLSGLRGTAVTSGSGPADNTRGGRFNFYVGGRAPTAVGGTPRPMTFGLRTSPNPISAAGIVRYAVPSSGKVSLGIYDVGGRRVRSLVQGDATAGEHALRWDGRSNAGGALPNGVYFARLDFEGRRATERILVLRR